MYVGTRMQTHLENIMVGKIHDCVYVIRVKFNFKALNFIAIKIKDFKRIGDLIDSRKGLFP